MLLIVDLDDTIFETKSMNPKIFQPVMDIIEDYFTTHFGATKTQTVLADMWKFPFDVVVKKHAIPTIIQDQITRKLDSLEYELNISVFDDYAYLKQLTYPKILVTTGFPKLQYTKLKALNITDDFEAIYIDNPLDKNRKYKQGIFQEIQARKGIESQHTWVIGDNPNSELIAGSNLGMRTIQRLKRGEDKASFVDYGISTFRELGQIL